MRRLRAVGARTGAGQGSGRAAAAGAARSGSAGARLLMVLAFELTFLSPLGALACLAALLLSPRSRSPAGEAARAAAATGLPGLRRGYGRPLLLAAACCAFGLAAAQPTIHRDDGGEVRSDVQALFVLDVSRSMLAAAGPTGATRLERARERRPRAPRPRSRGARGPRRADRPGAAVPVPDPRPARVRVDAAGGRHDRVAAAAAGRARRHQLRRARRARHGRGSSRRSSGGACA